MKIVNGFKALTIFAKRFVLDFWQGSKYAFGSGVLLLNFWLDMVGFEAKRIQFCSEFRI